MNRSLVSNRQAVMYTVCYLIIGSVFGRMLPYYLFTVYQWVFAALLGTYLLLFMSERWISARLSFFTHLYFLLQIVITLALLFVLPSLDGPQDYFCILFLPLCMQAMWRLPEEVGKYWVGLFAMTSAGSMIAYFLMDDSWEGVGYGLAYVATCIMVSAFSSVARRAEEARNESQALLAELQIANHKLQEYALQVEDLAAAQERNRLARELHDSVSQTIFSMTLTAQAARILLECDPTRVPAQLEHLQSLSQSALAEMRGLIQHLRPGLSAGEGLAAALHRHAIERRVRDGLPVDVQVFGDRRLPEAVEEGLFRVVQEALNNVVKHARAGSASVSLHLDQKPVSLCIEDHGIGFDLAAVRSSPGHLGLTSMAERVRSLGGKLSIDSSPGSGTRIRVEYHLVEEGEYA